MIMKLISSCCATALDQELFLFEEECVTCVGQDSLERSGVVPLLAKAEYLCAKT
jgi:hypothetical protein